MSLPVALWGLGATLLLALAVWLRSLFRHDVSIIDAAWGPMVLLPALVAFARVPAPGPRALPVLLLAALWAARLSVHILRRHRGQPEDRRYAAMRARHAPHFAWQSLYRVFLLQALLAWVVSAPLLAAVTSPARYNAVDAPGLALFAFGLAFEAVADAQLTRFKAGPAQRGQVMDRGLWRFTRHPNYFGECCLWWGLGLVGVAAGAAWALVSPLLMTLLLLKVSGVTLLEHDIAERRPAYRDYVRRTNAFVPGRPRP